MSQADKPVECYVCRDNKEDVGKYHFRCSFCCEQLCNVHGHENISITVMTSEGLKSVYESLCPSCEAKQ